MTTNETIQTVQADMPATSEELSDLELEAIAGGANLQTPIKPAHTVTQLPAHGGLQTSIGAFPASRSPFDRAQADFAKQVKAEASPRTHRPQFEIGY